MLVILVFALCSQSLAAIHWKNCGTGHDWVHVTEFNIEPNPIVLPGDMFITLKGSISEELGHQVTLDIKVEKRLLGTWVQVPCIASGTVGTCHYTDPCNYLRAYEEKGHCPVQLATNGMDCTCPFNPKVLNLPRARFSIQNISGGFERFLKIGVHDYRVTIKLKDKHQHHTVRMCIQGTVNIHV